jgi:predicted alpha/beta superfamily hydrolase
VSGNDHRLGAWRPDGLQLRPIAENEYHAEADLPRGSEIEFKITRGTWAAVEKSRDGADIANRRITAHAGALVLVEVERWGEEPRPLPHTTAPPRGRRVSLEHVQSAALGNRRAVSIHLPAAYDEDPQRRFPVLYFQDGQNLFDDASSASGVSWRADQTSDRLIAQRRIEPVILVGIHSTYDRINEYAPVADERVGSGGRGSTYVRFIVDELKPLVDGLLRTLPDRWNTAIGGSSLGGLLALHACALAPETFSRCAAISPSLWWAGGWMLERLEAAAWRRPLRLWMDTGTLEGGGPGGAAGEALGAGRSAAGALARAGLVPDRDFQFREFHGAAHHERDWAARFDSVLEYLFAAPAAR